MRGFGDKHDAWAVVARKGRLAASTASTAESHTGGQHAACEAPKASGKPAGRAKKAFKTVFSSSVVHEPRTYIRETEPSAALPPTEQIFVVGVHSTLTGLRPSLVHEVFEGVSAGWIAADTDLSQIRKERKGRAFLALPPQQHAPPGSALRRVRGFITVRVPSTVHRGGGVLVPRAWAHCDWWRTARSLAGVAAVHVRGDRRLDLIPEMESTVASLAKVAEEAGLAVDRVIAPEGRKFYMSVEHGKGVPITSVAIALRGTLEGLEAKGCLPLGSLVTRTETQCVQTLLLVGAEDPCGESFVAGMRVRVTQALRRDREGVAPPGVAAAAGEYCGPPEPGGDRGDVPPSGAGAGPMRVRAEGGAAAASGGPKGQDSRGPRPAVLRKKRQATSAEAVAMAVDVGWEAEDVAGVEGETFVAYKDTTNPEPAAGEGGFAAAAAVPGGAETRAVTAILGEVAAEKPEVAERLVQLGDDRVAPLVRLALVKDAEGTRRAIGLDGGLGGGPSDGVDADAACLELCRIIDDWEVTKQACGGRDPPPERWRALIAHQCRI